MSVELALHKALLQRLTGTQAVTDLVPATSILDRNSLSAPDPSIVFGEDQTLEGEDIARRQSIIVSTLHVWAKGTGLVKAKQIAGAVRDSIMSERLQLEAGYHCGDCRVTGTRYLRDPDGETGHGVLTIETRVSEA